MNMSIKLSCFILSVFLLTSCADGSGNGGISKQTGGTVIGGLGGALIGSQFGGGSGNLLAMGAGALIGAFAGHEIGKSMDNKDRQKAERASQRALEAGQSGKAVAWKNPDNGNTGSITPKKAYKANDGRYCRKFTHEVTIGGQQQKAYGTACRQTDGQWKIISEQ